jgi:hypothetical protein
MMKKFLIIMLVLFMLALVAGPAAAQDRKYALSIFHCNIQYVIGGLYGFVPLPGEYPNWELSPDTTEDMIIIQGFKPILDLLQEHPDWTLTIEMQAYYAEVVAARFPDVLQELKDLVNAGQVELVSFHYSDQLFIAFPYEDWKHSIDMTKQVFEDLGLTLSGVVFCQEGEGAEGMARRMKEEGYDIMAWPVNLWRYQHGEPADVPYYNFGDVKMIIAAKSIQDPVNGVYVEWTYMGDGELMAVGDWDPYFPWFFYYKPEAVAEYEAEVQALADQGYKVSSISGYVQDMIDAGIPATDPPPLLDGTWQPQSTDGTSRWLGHRGLWGRDERDNNVRSMNMMAHREIVAAETAAAAAGLDREDVLAEAWRQLIIGETSDGSGINPYRGEVEFCIASSAEAIRIARDVIEEAKEALGLDAALIDTATGEVTAGEFSWPGTPVGEAPLEVAIEASNRQWTAEWYRLDGEPETYRFAVSFTAGLDNHDRELYVTFPGFTSDIITTTALIDDEIRTYSRADFDFEGGHWYMPLPTGLVGLGNNWWVVKDMVNEHVVAKIVDGGNDIRIEDETAPWFETITWNFYVLHGNAAQALELADHINVHPVLTR